MIFITQSEAVTEKLGEKLAFVLKAGDIIAMSGDLGAGKTAFIRGMARGLGVKSRVTSPTYTIVNEYEGDIPLFHFDMYRLADADELYDIGWYDYLNRGGVCAIEWSENVLETLPENCIRVKIEVTGLESRTIEITGAGLEEQFEYFSV